MLYQIFKNFHMMIKRQIGHKIKQFKSTMVGNIQPQNPISLLLVFNTGLLVPTIMSKTEWLKEKFAIQLTQVSHFLLKALVLFEFWDYAFSTSVYKINSIPSNSHGMPPLEKLYGQKPNYSIFRVFVCEVFTWLCPYNSKKN